jgi:CDP-paratose 2-epimerase
VGDLVAAFDAVRSRSKWTAGQVYNVGGGLNNSVSLLEVMEYIEQIAGARMEYEMRVARPGDQLYYVTDHSKLTRDTGWTPKHNLARALQRMYEWSKENCTTTEDVSASVRFAGTAQEIPEAVS